MILYLIGNGQVGKINRCLSCKCVLFNHLQHEPCSNQYFSSLFIKALWSSTCMTSAVEIQPGVTILYQSFVWNNGSEPCWNSREITRSQSTTVTNLSWFKGYSYGSQSWRLRNAPRLRSNVQPHFGTDWLIRVRAKFQVRPGREPGTRQPCTRVPFCQFNPNTWCSTWGSLERKPQSSVWTLPRYRNSSPLDIDQMSHAARKIWEPSGLLPLAPLPRPFWLSSASKPEM